MQAGRGHGQPTAPVVDGDGAGVRFAVAAAVSEGAGVGAGAGLAAAVGAGDAAALAVGDGAAGSEGLAAGLAVGAAVGVAVGLAVGLAVGDAVGVGVGVAVGTGSGSTTMAKDIGTIRGATTLRLAAVELTVTVTEMLPDTPELLPPERRNDHVTPEPTAEGRCDALCEMVAFEPAPMVVPPELQEPPLGHTRTDRFVLLVTRTVMALTATFPLLLRLKVAAALAGRATDLAPVDPFTMTDQ